MDDASYDLDREDSAAKPQRYGFPVEPRRLLRLVMEHRRQLLRVFGAVTVVALVASFFVPQTYTSSAQLIYEGTLLDREDTQPAPEAFVTSAIAPSRLLEVRDSLGWTMPLEQLRARVHVGLEGQASMQVEADGGNAEDAQALAKAVLDVFLTNQASFNAKKLERLTAENLISLQRAKETRVEAAEAYEAFQEKSGKPDLIKEKDQLLARAATLRSKADEAAVEVAAQQARILELEQAQRDLPKQIVASAKRGSPVDTPLAQARAELAQARATLSAEHPRVQALTQRVASLQDQRGSERAQLGEQTWIANPARAAVDQEVATSRAALAAAQERESALRVLLKAIGEEAEALAPDEGEARQVLSALEVAHKRVEDLTKQAAAYRDAALRPLTGFRVLSAPMLPEESDPSKSYVLLLALIPFLATLVLALVYVARRLKTLTVEAPREVAWWGNGPVLGTSVWPRDPEALETFVDELEDYGVYGAGRTLVVPATEAEREIACSFAMRLAEAPWLAAAILDVGERAHVASQAPPIVTPAPGPDAYSAAARPTSPRQLSSQSFPAVSANRIAKSPGHRRTVQGFIPPAGPPAPPSPADAPVLTPPPKDEPRAYSSRPPRKRTVIGLPPVDSSHPPRIESEPESQPSSPTPSAPPTSGPQPFQRKGRPRATIRMLVPVEDAGMATRAEAVGDGDANEEAFLLTRPVPVASDQTPSRAARAVHVGPAGSQQTSASTAVMRAAVRLLGNEDEMTGLRRSFPPAGLAPGQVTGVAIAWNGPLSGPVLRRAARLAHRVLVVVSSGLSVIDLTRAPRRLGRDKGIGYVLVNLGDEYVDLEDRVGPVEAFWQASQESDATDSRRS